MAWNPSLRVKAARTIADEFEKKIVIVIMIDDEKLEYASYGNTQKLCKEAKKIADKCYDAAMKTFE